MAYPGAAESHLGAMKNLTGAVKVLAGALEAHPGASKGCPHWSRGGLILEQGKFFLGCGNTARGYPGAVKSHLRVKETFNGSEDSHYSPGGSPWRLTLENHFEVKSSLRDQSGTRCGGSFLEILEP
jgi:hypothetical protein